MKKYGKRKSRQYKEEIKKMKLNDKESEDQEEDIHEKSNKNKNFPASIKIFAQIPFP